MIWFFERQQSRLHYEIRHQPDGDGFELVITHQDGRQLIERYDEASMLVTRSRDLQHTLIASGWRLPVSQMRSREVRFRPDSSQCARQ